MFGLQGGREVIEDALHERLELLNAGLVLITSEDVAEAGGEDATFVRVVAATPVHVHALAEQIRGRVLGPVVEANAAPLLISDHYRRYCAENQVLFASDHVGSEGAPRREFGLRGTPGLRGELPRARIQLAD